MQQIPPQFSGGGSCPWLFVNISFKVKLAHCYLLSSPFSGASLSKFDWNCFFSVSLWSFPEKTCRIVFRGHLWTKRCMWRILPASETKPEWQKRLHQWKRVSVTKIFAKRVSVAEIFAKLQVWDEKLRQMHEIGKRVGIRRKRRSTEWNIFTVEDLANSRTEIKKEVKLCFLQQIFGPGKSFSEIKVKLLLQKIFSQILGSGKSRSKIKEKLL